MDDEDSLYSRQNSLEIYPPGRVCVIGVGGVGSWVALFAAQMGAEHLILIDDDVVELSNLNRTPFKNQHIGMSKVSAMMDLIMERRGTDVEIYPQRFEDLSEKHKADIRADSEYILDCRDSADDIGINCNITGGYDGYHITLHKNPGRKLVMGNRQLIRYRTIPSYLVPPVLIAATIVNYICCEQYHTDDKALIAEKTAHIDVKNLFYNLWKQGMREDQDFLDAFKTPCEVAPTVVAKKRRKTA